MIFQARDTIIFADDLTGTLDTAVQFAKHGIATIAFPTVRAFLENKKYHYKVYVINTSTRHLQPQEAYKVLFDLASYVSGEGCRRILKKTDSALRGNIGAELTAVMDAFQSNTLHFAPAYPDMNRYTLQGIHYCDGIPVSESVFGKDPFEPVKHSFIGNIIRETSDVKVRFASEEWNDQKDEEPTIHVWEAKSNGELRQICKKILNTDGIILQAGCAGLALALAEYLEEGVVKEAELPSTDKVLLISGSLNLKTLQQIEYLNEKGFPVQYVDWDSQCRKSYLESDGCQSFIDDRCRELQTRHVSVIATAGGFRGSDSERMERSDAGEAIASIVERILAKTTGCAMVVFGGDTLFGIVSGIIQGGMVPVKEIMPGVPASLARFKNGNLCVVVSRSGGFGSEDSAEKIIKLFRK